MFSFLCILSCNEFLYCLISMGHYAINLNQSCKSDGTAISPEKKKIQTHKTITLNCKNLSAILL